jgi:hypothetical protein
LLEGGDGGADGDGYEQFFCFSPEGNERCTWG